MASYEDKQTKKYMEYHDGIYFGIGCVLGTLCHTLFTFRWGEIHYTSCFSPLYLQQYTHLSKRIDAIHMLLTETKR